MEQYFKLRIYHSARWKSTSEQEEQPDFIEGLVTHKRTRKESYLNAVKREDNCVPLRPFIREQVVENNVPKGLVVLPAH
jgi:hypothetical protein